ncbi:MAG: penicillin acylase family protein [Sandarakinorhabdus sp.]
MRARISVAALLWALCGPAAAEPVTIHRDAMGVPHVFGETSAAVMFGAGYALAQDRLAAMELQRRAAAGRRAELLGKSAIETDKTARDRSLPDAELMRMYQAIPAEHQAMMQAYVDGINRAVAEVLADPERKTPLEFIRWGIRPTPWTLLEYLRYVASVPGGRYAHEIANLAFLNAMIKRHGERVGRQIFNDVVPVSDPDSPTVIAAGEDRAPARPVPVDRPVSLRAGGVDLTASPSPPAPTEPPQGASRCLVIGPQKSASGRVLMLQATADGPEIHLRGGGFDQAGFSFNAYGPPFMGRGVQHGWLLTSGVAQANSVFAEKLNPRNKYQYWFKGAWKDMERRTETILVKGAAPVTHMVARTVHGPVIQWDSANHVAFSHSFAMRGREIDNWVGILEMGRARSIDEFEAKGVGRMGWNLGICYGGADGQIAFWEAGTLPKLPAGVDPRLPIPGAGDHEWTGFLTPAEQPHVRNPKQGYLHAWNSKATSWSPEGTEARIGAAFRTWAGSQLAASNTAITLLDMRAINQKIFNAMGARDRTQTTPAFFAPYIRAAIAGSADPDVRKAGELMLSFNGLYQDSDADQLYDNAGLTLFRHWLAAAPAMVFGNSMGDWWEKVDEGRYLKYQTSLLLRAFQGKAASSALRHNYFKGRDRNVVLAETIKATVEQLRGQFPGKDMADWKTPIFWKYYDPAAKRPDRPGLPDSPEPARLSSVLKLGPTMAPHNGGEGWVGLMEIIPGHPAIYSVIDAGGQSLFIDPQGRGNPHLTDQTMMHEANELKKIVMRPDAVMATAVSRQTLDYVPARP